MKKLPDHHDVAGARHVERAGEARPLGALAGADVLIDPPRRDAGREQRVALKVEELAAVAFDTRM